jgi:hypothetical protein
VQARESHGRFGNRRHEKNEIANCDRSSRRVLHNYKSNYYAIKKRRNVHPMGDDEDYGLTLV